MSPLLRAAPEAGVSTLATISTLGQGVEDIDINRRRLEEAQRQIDTAAEWHFPHEPGKPVIPNSDIARAKYKAAIGDGKKCNLKDFAEGLHPLQDSWAHQGMPPLFGNKLGHSRKKKGTAGPAHLSHDADNVEYWPEDARAAATATFEAMKEFLEKCPCILDGPHKGEKSRCGNTMDSTELDKWLNGLFPGKNVEQEGGLPPGSH